MYTGDFSLFFQNTWQIRPNLTLNYGLRWETFFPYGSRTKRITNQSSVQTRSLIPQRLHKWSIEKSIDSTRET